MVRRTVVLSTVVIALSTPTTTRAAVTVFGGFGAGDGQFGSAFESGVTVDASGSVLVTDEGRHRIQKFTNAGVFLGKTGTRGSGTGNPPQFDVPRDVTVDPSGAVFVADAANNRIVKLDAALDYVTSFSAPEHGTVMDVAANEDFVYALEADSTPRILRFTNTASPAFSGASTGGAGADDGELAGFVASNGLALDDAGNVYVTDTQNNRVQKFSPALAFLGKWGTAGSGPGQFNDPSGIAISGDTVYVADRGNGRVQRFDRSGAFQAALSACVGNCLSPTDLSLDAAGNLFAAEPTNGRIARIDTTPEPGPITSDIPSPRTSQTVTFTLPHAKVDLWSVTGVEWDLDGNGTFEATGITASRRFDSEGSATVQARVTGSNGRTAIGSLPVEVAGSSASLLTPGAGLTGRPVVLDATGSALDKSTIEKVEFDAAGDGVFEIDRGNALTAATAYSAPGAYTPSVRVTRTGGRVDVATAAVKIAPAPPPGPVGMTVNGGAPYSRTPHVTLDVVWPEFATGMRAVNDGGFGNALDVPVIARIPWKLDSSGPERLPKTVYLRFMGDGIDTTKTFTDDIILDETPPRLAAAKATRVPGDSGAIRVGVKASDNASGVVAVEAAATRAALLENRVRKVRRTPVKRSRLLRSILKIKLKPGREVFARVIDAAGNPSKIKSAVVGRREIKLPR